MNKPILELQLASEFSNLPTLEQFEYWTEVALINQPEAQEIVIRIVDVPEMTELNESYRHKSGPTNILSFPFEAPEHFSMEFNVLGDLVLCAPVIAQEAEQQGKLLAHHWAHIYIHGILHLLGYDHLQETEAEEMEALEVKILSKLQINNPYQEPLNS